MVLDVIERDTASYFCRRFTQPDVIYVVAVGSIVGRLLSRGFRTAHRCPSAKVRPQLPSFWFGSFTARQWVKRADNEKYGDKEQNGCSAKDDECDVCNETGVTAKIKIWNPFLSSSA